MGWPRLAAPGPWLSCCVSALALTNSSTPLHRPQPGSLLPPRPLHTACSQPVALWIFSVCQASKEAPRGSIYLAGQTLGSGPTHSSQATDSCSGSRLQVWCPQLWRLGSHGGAPPPRGLQEPGVCWGCILKAFMSRITPVIPDPVSLGQCRSSAGAEVRWSCETPVADTAPGILWGL